MPRPRGATARPNRAPSPCGLPERSRYRVATCTPAGVVSTIFPFPPLTVSTSPPGAIARPRGALSAPPEVTSAPVPALLCRASAPGIALIAFVAVSAVHAVPSDCFADPALPVKDQQAAGFRRRGHAAGGRKAADNDPAMHDGQRSGEPDAARAGPWQPGPGDAGKAGHVAGRGDLDDRAAGALQVGLVVEVTDEHVAPVQPALAAADHGHAVRVDVTVGRHRRREGREVAETSEERGVRVRERQR